MKVSDPFYSENTRLTGWRKRAVDPRETRET